jgi:hypothetical protein
VSLTLREERLVGPKVVKVKNFFHFRGGACMKFNDLIFRKRLMNSSWRFRKKVLTELKSFFSTNGIFDSSILDMETASLRRDYTLLFGEKSAITTQLELECKCLPLNQRPTDHDRYALISEYAKLNFNGPSLTSAIEVSPDDKVSMALNTHYDFINRNTPKVTENWPYWSIWNGKLVGDFAAPNEAAARKILEEVEAGKEADLRGEEIPYMFAGYRALGFLGKDPLLDDPKVMEQETSLISYILEMGEVSEDKIEVSSLDTIDYEKETLEEFAKDQKE